MSRVITLGIILKQSIPSLESTWNPCLESTNNQYISPCILYKCIVSYQHTSTTGSLPEWSQIPRIPGIPKIQEKSFLIAQIMSLIPFCGVKYRDSNTPPPDQTPRWSPVGPPTNYYVYPITHHTVYIPCKYSVDTTLIPTQNRYLLDPLSTRLEQMPWMVGPSRYPRWSHYAGIPSTLLLLCTSTYPSYSIHSMYACIEYWIEHRENMVPKWYHSTRSPLILAIRCRSFLSLKPWENTEYLHFSPLSREHTRSDTPDAHARASNIQ